MTLLRMPSARPGFQLLSDKSPCVGMRRGFKYRSGEVYKPRLKWWQRLFRKSVAANRMAH